MLCVLVNGLLDDLYGALDWMGKRQADELCGLLTSRLLVFDIPPGERELQNRKKAKVLVEFKDDKGPRRSVFGLRRSLE